MDAISSRRSSSRLMSNKINMVDVVPCNKFAEQISAQAQVVNAPTEPLPHFWNLSLCQGTNYFPHVFLPTDCEEGAVVDISKNCMITMDKSPLSDKTTAKKIAIKIQNNIWKTTEKNPFDKSKTRTLQLRSWFAPPNYRFYIFDSDFDKYYIQEPNTFMHDICVQKPTYQFGNTGPLSDSGLLAVCKTDPVNKNELAISNWDAQNIVVEKIGSFFDLLLNSCNGIETSIGGREPLSKAWGPQTTGCDNLITSVCKSSAGEDNETMCRCFRQKEALDKKYGRQFNVPVCCFGNDPSGNIEKSCRYAQGAYKTSNMNNNCCSLSTCKQILSKHGNVTKESDGKVWCDGKLVLFPPSASVVAKPILPSGVTTTKKSIPLWVWIFVAITGAILLAFIISLAFVRRTTVTVNQMSAYHHIFSPKINKHN
jgi:hypothetical protein